MPDWGQYLFVGTDGRGRTGTFLLVWLAGWCVSSARLPADIFTALTPYDDGFGSLRQAIVEANRNPGPDLIRFEIGWLGGYQRIELLSPLPEITDTLAVDGTTQWTYSGQPEIELDGSMIIQGSTNTALLTISNTVDCVIRALLINGSPGPGIRVVNSTNAMIEGNYIGVGFFDSEPRGNGGSGVLLSNSFNCRVGGLLPDAANRLAFNTGSGISVLSGTGNTFRGNQIFTNGALGIDLGVGGVTRNDPGDADDGPNELQNFPVLTIAALQGTTVVVAGWLHAIPNKTCVVEFFSNRAADSSRHGEGETPLRTVVVTNDPAGDAAFSVSLPSVSLGSWITATATDSSGSTSEFCEALQVAYAPATFLLSLTKTGTGAGRVTSQPPGIDCGIDCSLDFPAGAIVGLTAVAEPGSIFAGWSGDGTGEVKRTIIMDGPKSIDASFNLPVPPPVNQAPSFTKGPDQQVLEDAGGQAVAGWATSITAGPPEESNQALTFLVSSDNPGLFAVQPAIDAQGTLTFSTAPNAAGTATVTVQLRDDGGTANGGQDTSALQMFFISIQSVNDAPFFTKGPDVMANQGSGPQTVPGWATGIGPGPPDEFGQSLGFVLNSDAPNLFVVQPAVSSAGTLMFQAVPQAAGTANVAVTLIDNGGAANGGVDASAPQFFRITILPLVDLSISAAAAPIPASLGSNLVIRLTVVNNHPQAARSVVVTSTVPATAMFAGATATQGACSHANGVVLCSLGDLGGGASAEVWITLVPNLVANLIVTAGVSALASDLNPVDNGASVAVGVKSPSLDVRLVQGGAATVVQLYVVPTSSYFSFVQYVDAVKPNALWAVLPGGPHSGLLTLTNVGPTRFYRTILIPK